jgi:hypothetical protein
VKFLHKIKPFWPVFLLAAIELILFFTNYVPKTYFLGWDNIFAEMNLGVNLKRSIFAVWEEYRGLGFLDGMSFAANLPHYIFLYVVSIFLPNNLIRYFSIFFLHFLGGIGIYFLLNYFFKASPYKRLISFLGALFYLFNFATIQMFYAPYELFSIHFAFLPWLALFLIKFLNSGKKKDFILFSVFSFISISQAHVPTIFITYLVMLFVILAFHFAKEKKQSLKKIGLILLVVISFNAFWGLPYLYFGLTGTGSTVNSKVNQMSNESAYLINKARGDFVDVVMLKGFWLDYTDLQSNGKNNYIMPVWRAYSSTIPFTLIGSFFFLLAVVGIIYAIRKKDRRFYPFIFLFVFCFIMLGTDIPAINSLFYLFYNHVPLFSQIFRFTFTKFSILYVFSFTILLSLAIALVLENARKIKPGIYLFPLFFLAIIFYYAFPSFQGQFIYPNLRVKIPSDYFKLVNFFNGQNPNERIALLPQTSYWGWTYTDWGYRGSGFIWYGLPQPSIDGSTLPWSRQNENYYWELDQAVNSQNRAGFEAVLEKYQLKWIVLDNSAVSQYSSNTFSLSRIQNLINEEYSKIHKVKSIGKIDIYEVDLNLEQKNFVSFVSGLPQIGPSYNWGNFDTAYIQNSNYAQNANVNDLFYPFRTLFTGKNQSDLEFKLTETADYFSFQSKIPIEYLHGTLDIPSILKSLNVTNLPKEEMPQVYIDNELVNINGNESKITLPYLREGNLEIRIPKISSFFDYNTQTSQDLFDRTIKSCNSFNVGPSQEKRILDNNTPALYLTGYDSTRCLDFNLPYNPQNIAYLITVKSKYIEGKSLLFSIINRSSLKPDFESNLPKINKLNTSYFIVPPIEPFGLGYDLYFYNVSLGNVRSTNELAGLEVKTIPYDFLTGVKVEKNNLKLDSKNINPNSFSVSHPNPSLYAVKITKNLTGSTLILSQSFDPGWHAYSVNSGGLLDQIFPFITGGELKNHETINNWENGWEIQSNKQNIIIVYLPQYLEYFGLILVVGTLVFLALNRHKNLT